MDILYLHREKLSQRAIARKLGISRNTVKNYLENFEQGSSPIKTKERKSVLDPFSEMIKAWIQEDEYYTGTWIYDRLTNIGYTGSYETVKRKVKDLKQNKQQIAYMRFETMPGCQAQVDFGEFQLLQPDGTIKKLYLFSMILGYSRKQYTELIECCDMPTFLDCHIRAFHYFNGVPSEILYDRMKNVYIRKLAGKDIFNSTLVSFAIHYRFKPMVAPAYSAWVKGKVERPFTFVREGFWRGYGYVSLYSANKDLEQWIKQKEERIHGTTHEKVSVRFIREQPHLSRLPSNDFDTSYRIYRKVFKDCTVRFECNSYVVVHTLVGQKIVLRVKDKTLRVFADDKLIVTYTIPEGKGHLVQDKRFYEALKKDQAMNRRKYYGVKRGKGRAKMTISPIKPKYDMDVQVRTIQEYEQIAQEDAA